MAKKSFSRSEIEVKIKRVEKQLSRIQEVKQLLLADGQSPDKEDKVEESRLIQMLLGFEKDLKRMGTQAENKTAKFAKAKKKQRPWAH